MPARDAVDRQAKTDLVLFASLSGRPLIIEVDNTVASMGTICAAMYQELKDDGFTVISIALDKDAEQARPWLALAELEPPGLIDTKQLLIELYSMVNLPTILWLDGEGEIVRPNAVAYDDNTWQEVTGFSAEVYKTARRNRVKTGTMALNEEPT